MTAENDNKKINLSFGGGWIATIGVIAKIVFLIFSAILDKNKARAKEKSEAASLLTEGLAEKDETKIGAAWDRIRRIK